MYAREVIAAYLASDLKPDIAISLVVPSGERLIFLWCRPFAY